MTIYYFTICILTGLGYYLTEKQKKAKYAILYDVIVFICLTALCSFRYAIGFDYFSYRSIYEMTAEWSFGDILHYRLSEPLFFVVCRLFLVAGLPFQCLIAGVSSFVILTALWFIRRYSSLPWMSVYLYITLQFLAYDMNLMRQAVAVSFFLLSYPFLEQKKPAAYSILIFAGGLFHNSLWLVSPLYIFLSRKLSRKSASILVVLTAFVYLLFDRLFLLVRPFLPEKYAVYPDTYFWNANSWEYLILPALYCLLIILFQNRIRNPRRRTIYLNSACLYFLLSLFITRHFIIERFAVYPFVFSLTAIPEICTSFRKKTARSCRFFNRYQLVVLLFLAFGGAFFLFAAAKGFHQVYPYTSLLDQSHSVPVGI